MQRNSRTRAVVLTSRDWRETNRSLCLFTEEEGLLWATVYGGGKSKLRGLASPYHEGDAWIYYDPVRDSRKLSDFEPRLLFPGVRESLARSVAASLAAELAMKTHSGGGEHRRQYALLVDALSAIDRLEEARVPYAAIQLASRELELAGLLPELSRCSHCGRPFQAAENCAPGEAGVACASCAEREGWGALHSAPGADALAYLAASMKLPFKEALRLSLGEGPRRRLSSLLLAQAAKAIGSPLKSVEAGGDLL